MALRSPLRLTTPSFPKAESPFAMQLFRFGSFPSPEPMFSGGGVGGGSTFKMFSPTLAGGPAGSVGNGRRIADENPIEPISPDGKAMAQAPVRRGAALLAPQRRPDDALMLGTKKLLGQ